MGGKARLAKKIKIVLDGYRTDGQLYVEPFTGGANMLIAMDGNRLASDSCEYIIAMHRAIQNGWLPPVHVTEEEYRYVRENKDENKALTGFVGYGCSFGGKFFGGYARINKRGDSPTLQAYRGCLKIKNNIDGVTFTASNYSSLKIPKGSLIYCDPPYFNTTNYGNNFDTKQFWQWVRVKSEENIVIVSEYAAPDDFECLASFKTKVILSKNNNNIDRIEKLFKYKG